MTAARQSAPSRTFGLPGAGGDDVQSAPATGQSDPSGVRQLLGKISLSSFKNARPSFSFSIGRNDTEIERPPIPTMMKPSGEIYSTPLPRLSMVVLSITMLGEFLCANVSTPFLLFMVKGFGEFSDDAEVAFWTGILVATFFLTQFVTSLLWATAAEKHGRRAVLTVSLLGSAITCGLFGTSMTLQQAVCIRLLQGVFAGAVGVARGCVPFVTDPSNEGRAYAILGFAWGFGGVAGAIVGGAFERPATKWPQIFGEWALFVTYPYLLPCAVAALVTLLGSILSLFLGHDGGPRESAIRLPPDKLNIPSPISEEESSSPGFEADDESRSLAQRLQKKISRKFSGLFTKRTPDGVLPASPVVQPPVPLASTSSGIRLDRTRTFSTSRTNGSAYGYSGGYRHRLASNVTWNGRRGSMGMSLRRRSTFNSNRDDGSELNFAQRLLLANENAVTNIADLWVAAAMNVDNEDPFESDSDTERDIDQTEPTAADLLSPLEGEDAERISPAGTVTPPSPAIRPHRPSIAASMAGSHRSTPHRPSVSFAIRPPIPRRPSTNVPAIFAHSGVKTPPAVLDAQQLVLSPVDSAPPERSLAALTDPLAPISETSRTGSVDVESLVSEKPPSLMSQLPVVVIVQYGVMALHTTTHDQIFLSYLVSDYEIGGLNLNAAHFAQLIALMSFVQIAYQFYLYPNIGPPRGRFSHLAMFRIGTFMFIPAYLSVILYRPLHNVHPDDSNIILMAVLSISTAIRYCGITFGYTAISILLNYMTPPDAVGYANGFGQSIVSLARCAGPVIGGYVWAVSVKDSPSGYYLGFVICAAVCALSVLQSLLIR